MTQPNRKVAYLEPNRHLVGWTIGMQPDEKASFLNILNNSSVLVERVRQILSQKLEALEAVEISTDNFDQPGFAERSAYHIGQKRVLKDLQALFTI